jgi:hypothetical protein
MEAKVNISWQNDVCSEVCKYAFLVVSSAREFAHMPQRMRNYIEHKNCTEDEGEVLKAAEAYYIKRNGVPTEEEYKRRFHMNETWEEALDRLEQEYTDMMDRVANFFEDFREEYDIEQNYIDQLNQAFEDNRDAIIDKLPTLLDLRKHPSHKHGKINLCHGCIMPYDNGNLITIEGRILCKFVEGTNEEPCYQGEEKDNPDDIREYLNQRNQEFKDRFKIYLNKNMERLKNHSEPYECERCEKPLTISQVQQVIRNISCEKCVGDWAEQLYEQEKIKGTLEEKPKPKSGGQGSRKRREERRKGKQKEDDSARDD